MCGQFNERGRGRELRGPAGSLQRTRPREYRGPAGKTWRGSPVKVAGGPRFRRHGQSRTPAAGFADADDPARALGFAVTGETRGRPWAVEPAPGNGREATAVDDSVMRSREDGLAEAWAAVVDETAARIPEAGGAQIPARPPGTRGLPAVAGERPCFWRAAPVGTPPPRVILVGDSGWRLSRWRRFGS